MKLAFRGLLSLTVVGAVLLPASCVQAHVQTAAATKCNLSKTSKTIAATPGKCTILFIGDSLGDNLASGVINQLKGTSGLKLVNLTRSSSGLSNSWFYSWPKELPAMLTKHKPDLVVMFIGANDHQDIRSKGKNLRFGSKPWVAAYSSDVKKIVDQSTAAGATVAWFGLPSMRSVAFGNYMKVMNETVQSVVPAVKDFTYVPTWEYLSTSKGKFLEYAKVNGSRQRLRGQDGIHFSSTGQKVLGAFAVVKIAEIYNVTLVAKEPVRLAK